MNRYLQIVIWVFLAPTLGAIQALASFSVLMLRYGHLGNSDLHRIVAGLALVYGGGWFVPALVISDLFLLRRTLSRREFTRYLSAIAITNVSLGFVMPGIMVMIGYPVAACAILGCGYAFRMRQESLREDAEAISGPQH